MPQVAIDALCKTISVSHDDVMQWVDSSFEQVAKEAYITIGSSFLYDIKTGWSIFSAISNYNIITAAIGCSYKHKNYTIAILLNTHLTGLT